MDQSRDKSANERDIAGSAIRELSQALHGKLITQEDPDYDNARKLWNGLIDKRPALIVRCADVSDVIASVNFARGLSLELAVRGGGHNVAGRALCEGGLVIDLSRMRAVRVDPERKTATVEGGATLGDLDEETQRFGLAAPVGVISDTGVGGLTLHGGYGWLTRRFGLSIDNLLAVDIVTADGELRHVSAEEEPDLFWAVRGGGGNFGVVTSFEFRLHDVGPKVWLGMTFYPFEYAAEGLRRFREYVPRSPEELGTLAILGNVPDNDAIPSDVRGKPTFLFLSCYSGSANQGEAVLRPLRELGEPLADLSQPIPFLQMQRILDADYPNGRNYYWKSVFLKELSDGAIDVLITNAAERPSELSSVDIWGITGGAIDRVPRDATPFGMRNTGPLIGIEANWDDAEQTQANIAWARRLYEQLKPFSAGGSYLNFPGFAEEGENLVKGAYGGNYERLKNIKRKYDPDNLFHGNFNITPG